MLSRHGCAWGKPRALAETTRGMVLEEERHGSVSTREPHGLKRERRHKQLTVVRPSPRKKFTPPYMIHGPFRTSVVAYSGAWPASGREGAVEYPPPREVERNARQVSRLISAPAYTSRAEGGSTEGIVSLKVRASVCFRAVLFRRLCSVRA